ncbi:MAG: pyrroline-5-carboxylate reductase [Desulfobacteraceae bacterium]|nr:pyrroline-5-carboxylate reductase [Desulfobacteraceae bacterium]
MKKQIGFIGAGNMAEAMIGAVLGAGLVTPDNLFISDPDENRKAQLQSAYGLQTALSNKDLVARCDIVIFAVKPQVIDTVLQELAEARAFAASAGRRLFMSIAAGIPLARIEKFIYAQKTDAEIQNMPVLRVMPNTPALVGAGMSGLCANMSARADDMEIARTLLSAMGNVRVVNEEQMDAVTALSGSGPAYAFYLLEAMIEAGCELGLQADAASDLAESAVSGALSLIRARNEDPETLRSRVTSPGGTTEAAIRILDRHQVKQAIVSAVTAAAQRSRQLSQPGND